MPSTITKFWSQISPKVGELNIHPEDRKWFERHDWTVQNQPTYTFDQFIRSDRLGNVDDQLHLSLIPVPFVGSLEKAKIIILLMNPGLTPSDYYAEENTAFREACVRNLHQANADDEFPFYKLNPEFAWSGGFIWWEALMRPILSKLLERNEFSTYYETLAFLSKKIAAIELVPYHSVGGSALSGSGKPWKNLPSAIQARSFVQRLCEAKEKPLILVLRSHERWELNTHPECTCTTCPVLRRPTLNPNLDGPNGEAGRAILRKLGVG